MGLQRDPDIHQRPCLLKYEVGNQKQLIPLEKNVQATTLVRHNIIFLDISSFVKVFKLRYARDSSNHQSASSVLMQVIQPPAFAI